MKNLRYIMLVGFCFLVSSYQNCGNYNFSTAQPSQDNSNTNEGTPGGGGGTNNVSPCTPQQATNLRVMFMVDGSGSTVTDDPNAGVRGTSALDFINQNSSNTNLTYSYGSFANNSLATWNFGTSKFVITSPSQALPSAAFGTSTQATTAVNAFVAKPQQISGNGTSYTDAFGALQSLVTTDEAANPGYNYVVIFMSDGQPNEDATSDTAIGQLVSNLLTAGGAGRITVSSLYFNNVTIADDQEAATMLNIATVGMGQYVNVLTNSPSLNLNQMIQNLVIVPANACH